MILDRAFPRSERDVFVLAAALVHGALLVTVLVIAPGADATSRAILVLGLALLMCWGANTVSHIHLHAPLFPSSRANQVFSLYLTLLLAVPQRWWRRRHLHHHGIADDDARRSEDVLEWMALAAGFALFACLAPGVLVAAYLPALALGLGLCATQGRQEHARAAAGVDHRGRLYNLLWFNDGFHAAHHRWPDAHWTRLPVDAGEDDVRSAWPPILRGIERLPGARPRDPGEARGPILATALDALERMTFDVAAVRGFVLRVHRRAFLALLSPVDRADLRTITVVGGGLFPRTVLALSAFLPDAEFTILEADRDHLERARELLAREMPRLRVRFVHGRFDGGPTGCDLLVVPLAFRGDRMRLYRAPPARRVIVHDWIWRRAGRKSATVSPLLLKRLNLVAR